MVIEIEQFEIVKAFLHTNAKLAASCCKLHILLFPTTRQVKTRSCKRFSRWGYTKSFLIRVKNQLPTFNLIEVVYTMIILIKMITKNGTGRDEISPTISAL